MTRLARLLRDRDGSAAAELAFVTPLLLILMFGSFELGRYFWSEHQLIKSVRDASVFVSRQQINNFDCAAATVNSGVISSAQALVRTGVLSGGTDRLPNWTHETASITVSLSCVTAAGGTTLGGIYTGNANNVPVVTIDAQLPYDMILRNYGLSGTYTLRAKQQSAVVGA